MTTIQLDDDWECAYSSVDDSAGDAGVPELNSLRDLIPATAAPGKTLVCRRRFSLEPLDYCARYLLHVDSAPGPLVIVLRGEALANADDPLTVDVTDFVSLDDNLLELQLDLGGALDGDPFGAVWLEAVPCAE